MIQNDKNLFSYSSGVARFKNQYYEAKIRVLARPQLQSLFLFFPRSALVCDNILDFKARTLHFYLCPSSHDLCVSMCAHMCVSLCVWTVVCLWVCVCWFSALLINRPAIALGCTVIIKTPTPLFHLKIINLVKWSKILVPCLTTFIGSSGSWGNHLFLFVYYKQL